MSARLAKVTMCDDCPEAWFYLGMDCCCILMNNKRCFDDVNALMEDENIPDWCPLPLAKEGDL